MDKKYLQQFVLTKTNENLFGWKHDIVLGFNLYTHPALEVTKAVFKNKQIYLLGSIYDWERPLKTNQEIIDSIGTSQSMSDFFSQLLNHGGHYIIIYSDTQNMFIIGDATSSREIYYDLEFSIFGSQPKLLCEFICPIPYSDIDAIDFYSSKVFNDTKLFLGDTTHLSNIKHLLPNTYIDVIKKEIKRYFPINNIHPQKMSEVVPKICNILRGFIIAAEHRKKLLYAITSGYDSRLLFLAGMGTNQTIQQVNKKMNKMDGQQLQKTDNKDFSVGNRYFIYKHKHMNNNHHDIRIPKLLTNLFGKSFEIIDDLDEFDDVSHSIDFPINIPRRSKYYRNYLYINGNISEIAKNQYSIRKYITPYVLASIRGYNGLKYPIKIYSTWINDIISICETKGYNIADMFNWEDSKGIWFAKAFSHDVALGIDSFTPYNSHNLLSLLLSVDARYRNKYYHKLYHKIMLEFDKNALKYPINPCFKSNIYKLLTVLKIFNILKIIYLKYGFKSFFQKIKRGNKNDKKRLL